MKLHSIILLILLLTTSSTFTQHQEKPAGIHQPNLPDWATMMYAENPDVASVIAAYDAYYEAHDFIKNGHTQYYKHWLRNLSRDVNGVFSGANSWKNGKLTDAAYLQRKAQADAQRGPNSAWECIGPFDFDKDAAERSYAPGSAHVYTVEKAPSNSNVLYVTRVSSGTNFKHYYQFNEASGDVFNRAGGGSHAVLQGTASRTTSTAPVGGGESFTVDCSTSGVKSFTNTDLSIEFPVTGTYPSGDLVVSRLDLNPDQLPNNFPESPSYWVINNYGTNATFSPLENIIFENVGNVPGSAVASEYKLYKRNDNDDGTTWGNSVDYADALTTGNPGSTTFGLGNGISSFSQFIIMRESAVLPIQLLQFAVSLNDQQTVDIEWTTAEEINNDHFVIEKSRDGVTFETLGIVESQGNSDNVQFYKTIDRTPHEGTSFYRLKQVDLNGQFTYSDIQTITINAPGNPIVIFPNPITVGQELTIKSTYTEDLEIVIFGTDGKELLRGIVPQGNGTIQITDLSAGAYLYRIIGAGFLKNGVLFIE
jgi:hypothetical protein